MTDSGRDDARQVRERALAALREGRFDLAEDLLAGGDATLATLVENLRMYQAELELQNEELRRSETAAELALSRFTALFTHVPLAQLVADRHGLVREANAEARRLFALGSPSAHSHFLFRLVDEHDRPAVIDLWRRLAVGELPAGEQHGLRLHTSNGNDFYGDLHVARLPGPPGADAEFICAVIDRTEEAHGRDELLDAYRRLQQSQEAYRVLAEFSPDWDYWLDPKGRFLHVSPGCKALSGHGPEAFIADPDLLGRLIHPDDRPRWEHHLHHECGADDRDGASLRLRLISADGSLRWIRHVCCPVVADDGRFLGRRGVNRDITHQVEAEQALRTSERKYRTLFESAGQGMLILQDGVFVSVNRAALMLLGHNDGIAVLKRRPEDLSPPQQPDGESSADKVHRLTARALSGNVQRFEWEHLRADGSAFMVQITLSRIDHWDAPALLVTWHDLEPERSARARERLARTVFENTTEGIVITDLDEHILAVNRAFTEITGYSEAEVLGKTPRLLASGRQQADFYQSMWATLNETGQWRGELWNRRKNGEVYPQLSTISAVHDDSGRLTNYICVLGDITQIKRSEEALYRLAHHDALTGLPNRTLLHARVDQAIARAERHGGMLGLLFLDLDLFKTVNDSLGHPVGDALLQQVAETMAAQVRAADSIARLGGDEFVVLMEDLDDPNAAATLARRLLTGFAAPFQVQGRELYITASIGISIYPADGCDMNTLLANADMAMYQAKEHGRNTYRFFEPAMTEGALERLRLETALRGASARGELRLAYQPQFRLEDGTMQGVEALLRWHHPELGEVPPGRFIPVAEEIGLIVELGALVLEQGCRQLVAWDDIGFHVPRLAVNLSVHQLEHSDLPEQVMDALQRTGVAPSRLELEVTESMFMRNADQAIDALERLRAYGVSLAVDDFGAGFSSMTYLKRLPVRRLKIDKAFVDHLTRNAADDAIARAIITLGRGLGLDVLAEGVETRAQADFMRDEGCSEAQGYLFGRPMAPDALQATLSAGLS